MPWAQSGNVFRTTYPDPIELPVAVYSVNFSMFSGFYLEQIGTKFDLPNKIYEIQPGLVDRVVTSHKNLGRSMGVLLSGLKGAGKSVTAKQICNRSNLPVLVVDEPYEGLEDFLSSLEIPVVVFMDEYEKVFDIAAFKRRPSMAETISTKDNSGDKQSKMLSLMDGAMISPPHLYVMTVNDRFVSPNMIDRPSRVRYAVEFGHLTVDIISEIVDDLLEDKSCKEVLIEWLSRRAVLSIDAIVSVVREVNWFGCDVDALNNWFNLSVQPVSTYNVIRSSDNKIMGSCYSAYFDTFKPGERFDLNMLASVMHRDYHVDRTVVSVKGTSCVVVEHVYAPTSPSSKKKNIEPKLDMPEFETFAEMFSSSDRLVLGVYSCTFENMSMYHSSFLDY